MLESDLRTQHHMTSGDWQVGMVCPKWRCGPNLAALQDEGSLHLLQMYAPPFKFLTRIHRQVKCNAKIQELVILGFVLIVKIIGLKAFKILYTFLAPGMGTPGPLLLLDALHLKKQHG